MQPQEHSLSTHVVSVLGAIASMIAVGGIFDAMSLELPIYVLPALGAGIYWLKVA